MKILMIEDDIDLAESVKFQLEKEGFTVDVCHDGEEGLYYMQEKIKRELESLKQYIMLPKTVVQAEKILEGMKTIFWELLSLTILGIKKWKKS